MACNAFFFLLVTLLLGLTFCHCIENYSTDQTILQGKTWCVAQISAPANKLQSFLDDACSKNDCREIRPGGSCFDPNTVLNHASYVLDLVYRETGNCNTEIGTPALSDPSFGKCHYP